MNIIESARRLIAGHFFVADVLDLASTLLFLSLTVPVLRKLSVVSGVYYLAFQSLYLVRIASPEPLLGMSRYVLALFPAFLILAEWGRHRWFHRTYLYLSWAGLLFMSGQFAIWGWVG